MFKEEIKDNDCIYIVWLNKGRKKSVDLGESWYIFYTGHPCG